MKTKILFIHQNFPGQFKHLADRLNSLDSFEVFAIGRENAVGLPGIRLFRYKTPITPKSDVHPFLIHYDNAIHHGTAVARQLRSLDKAGWRPDLVIAHPGWGEALFVKDVFPHCKLINFCEFYYHVHGADANFDTEFPSAPVSGGRIRLRNSLHLTNLESCDVAITPTRWQHSLHPPAYKDKLRILHEGINTSVLVPNSHACYESPDGQRFFAGEEIVTFVSRNLEPYRGFHVFMRALKVLFEKNKTCKVLVVGGDGVSYGFPSKTFRTWREQMVSETNIDVSRIIFLGKIPYHDYIKVLQVSRAHVYLTYPFVLSWSLLEALSCQCLVIASDTPPVREFITDNNNGLLVDFFDHHELASSLQWALLHNRTLNHLQTAARESVLHLSVDRACDEYLNLINEQIAGMP